MNKPAAPPRNIAQPPSGTAGPSPAVPKKKAQRRGSGTTNTTNKTGKTNKTKSSNVTNKTKSTAGTKSSTTSTKKKKSTSLPPKNPASAAAGAIAAPKRNPSAPSPPGVTPRAAPSPRMAAAGKKAPAPTSNAKPQLRTMTQNPPKPPSMVRPSAPAFNRRASSSHAGALIPKPAMRAPARPTGMATESNALANRRDSVQQPRRQNPNRLDPRGKSKSVAVHSRAVVPIQRLPARAKSLEMNELAATESDSSGEGTCEIPSTVNSNPLQDLLNRTKSFVGDLISPTSMHDGTLHDAHGHRGDAVAKPMTRGLSKHHRRQSGLSRYSDHGSLGANSSHHLAQTLPPPPNRVNSIVQGLGGASLHGGSNHSLDGTVHSMTRTVTVPFPDDPKWKIALRYLRILPPAPNETPRDRRIRMFIWASLFLDLICAIVAIGTFTQVITCCGKPIWSLGGGADWTLAMTVVSYIYIVGIVMEIIPVVRDSGIPWNVMNPLFGFLLTFAVFFDDSRAEAISMWILETIAVFFDFLVYRLKRQKHAEKMHRLDEINQKLEPFFASNRKAKVAKSAGIDVSFHDCDLLAMEEEDGTVADHREIKLLRDRRYVRKWLVEDQKHLTYHLVGVVFNSVLIFITLIFIVCIATTGGMCVHDGNTPNPFSQHQLEMCSSCQGTAGVCEICTAATTQCYYPY